MPKETPALTLNRLCGSGLQAIISAAQAVKLGDADVAVGGGAESMSRGGYALPTERWGARMGNAEVMDMMVGALTDPFDTVHMGITAENVAAKWGVSRQQQDELAVESNKRAINAIEKGYFKEQILPIELKGRKGPVIVDTDEHPRADASMDGMAKLRTVLQEGRHGHRRQRQRHQRRRRGGRADGAQGGRSARASSRWRAWSPTRHAGVDPKYMGIGPVPAVKKALERAGLRIEDMDVVELERGLRRAGLRRGARISASTSKKVNPNGGAIALGHPIGATGGILTVKAMLRAAAHRRPLRPGHDVHRRRPGHRGGVRAALMTL